MEREEVQYAAGGQLSTVAAEAELPSLSDSGVARRVCVGGGLGLGFRLLWVMLLGVGDTIPARIVNILVVSSNRSAHNPHLELDLPSQASEVGRHKGRRQAHVDHARRQGGRCAPVC